MIKTKKAMNRNVILLIVGFPVLAFFMGWFQTASILGGIESTKTELLADNAQYWEFRFSPILRENPTEISCTDNKLQFSVSIPYGGVAEREPSVCSYVAYQTSCSDVEELINGKTFNIYRAVYGGQDVKNLDGSCKIGLAARCDDVYCRDAVILNCQYSGYVDCVDNKINKHQGTSVYVRIPKDGVTQCYDDSWCKEGYVCKLSKCVEKQDTSSGSSSSSSSSSTSSSGGSSSQSSDTDESQNEEANKDTSSSLSYIDRFNLWIDSLINKISELFK